MIKQSDSLKFLKSIKDYENDIIYSDPPYALGSEVVIRPDGKVDYKKANDFMNKWEMPTGKYWEQWFKEAFRTLKHGGYCIMFGMDRQLLLFKYYAALAGFQEQQSLYWYSIQNFPKAVDLSKQIDKNAGAEREQVGVIIHANKSFNNNLYAQDEANKNNKKFFGYGEESLTKPSTNLAKKYEGYKYSISPLKQTCETVMVFKKPNKTGSVLHDTLAYENGDETITVSALNIDGNRVDVLESDLYDLEKRQESRQLRANTHTMMSSFTNEAKHGITNLGRYPAQTFIDSRVVEKLDLQTKNEEGCSKILHKCDYEQIDFDLFIYQPKVSTKERNAGLDTFEDLKFNSDVPIPQRAERPFNLIKNNHPTLKPLSLNEKVLRLFKTPNEQKICYPFAGAGSEIIGGIKAGFDNWTACELSQDYVDIAKARIEYWTKNKNNYESKPISMKSKEIVKEEKPRVKRLI